MPGRSASYDNEPASIQQPFFIVDYCRKHYTVAFHIDPAAHTIVNATGLFINLFQHKVRITALFKLSDIEFHRLYFRLHPGVFQIDYFQFFSPVDHGNLSVFQIDNLIGIFHNRSSIGSQKKLLFTNSHHQRATLACSNDLVGLALIEHRDCISPDYFIQCQLYCRQQIQIISVLEIFD